MKLRYHLDFWWHSIKMTGFWDGTRFWVRWTILDPIRFKCYEIFKTRTWCSYEGWMCEKGEDCEYKHYAKAPRIKDYMIQKGEKCTYCGEEPATTHIHNPNTIYKESKDGPFWKVCETCEKAIELQEEQAMHAWGMMKFNSDEAEEKLIEVNKKIEALEKKTGKKMTTIEVRILESGKLDAKEIK